MSDKRNQPDGLEPVVYRCQNAERWRWNWGQVISVIVIVLSIIVHYFASEAATTEALGRYDERITNNSENIKTNRTDIRELRITKADK